jgi:hypothetical protein
VPLSQQYSAPPSETHAEQGCTRLHAIPLHFPCYTILSNFHFKGIELCRDLGSVTMEQWFLFVVVLSPAVLFDVNLLPKVEQMWGHLRAGLTYFMSYATGQHRRELWNQARNQLLHDARLAEPSPKAVKGYAHCSYTQQCANWLNTLNCLVQLPSKLNSGCRRWCKCCSELRSTAWGNILGLPDGFDSSEYCTRLQ